MLSDERRDELLARQSPHGLSAEEYRRLGHILVDQTADLLASIPDQKLKGSCDPEDVWKALGDSSIPEQGEDAEAVLAEAVSLMSEHSLFNGHPKFWGYITSSPAPIGILGDMLASATNPNCGGWMLSPMASSMEMQTVQWIAELIGYPTPCGGLLVSGGNVANILGLFAARVAAVGKEVRETGVADRKCAVYASSATHTWIQKAVDLSGIGTESIRHIPIDDQERMRADALADQIKEDVQNGVTPIAVVVTSGTVSTGAVDPIEAINAICREHGIWLHVDGAYGAPAAALPEADADLKALKLADSVALDPHKWLYSPLEAGCLIVKDKQSLLDAFSYRPPYYWEDSGEEGKTDFFEFGIQNSRGFRALKVWLGLKQAGREGCIESIRQDIDLTKAMADALEAEPEIEVFSRRLSIVTFRWKPAGFAGSEEDMNRVTQAIMDEMFRAGDAYVSHAVQNGMLLMRACIVNINTKLADVEALPGIVCRLGRAVMNSGAWSAPGE